MRATPQMGVFQQPAKIKNLMRERIPNVINPLSKHVLEEEPLDMPNTLADQLHRRPYEISL
jgi:hypothetical protein